MLGLEFLLPFLGKSELRFRGSFGISLKELPLHAMWREFFNKGLARLREMLRRLVLRFLAMLLM